jgi:L-lactate permease
MKLFEYLDKQGAELTPEQVVCRVVMMVARTLCTVVLSLVAVLLYAFFDPTISNDAIFSILGPAFSTIVGGFIGLLAGINLAELINKFKEVTNGE